MRNLHLLFDWHYIRQLISGDFSKFYGLLRIYELYDKSEKNQTQSIQTPKYPEQARRSLCRRRCRAIDTGGYMKYHVLYYVRVAAALYAALQIDATARIASPLPTTLFTTAVVVLLFDEKTRI